MTESRVVPYEQLLLARLLKEQKAAIRGCAEIVEAGERASRYLEVARDALQSVSDECARAGRRFEESRRFRDDCDAAAALTSVEEMISRRDELVARRERYRQQQTK